MIRPWLLAQRQKPATHHAGEVGPADQRDDEGDGEIDLDHVPGAGQRGGQAHPERNGRHRPQDLDDALDDEVHPAAVEAGDAAQQHAQEQAQHHAGEADEERDARGHQDARIEVAAELVGAEEEHAFPRAGPLDAEEVDVGLEDPQQVVGVAADEHPHRQLARGVGRIGELEGARVAHAAQPVDMRVEAVLVEEVDALRRDEAAAGVGGMRIGRRQEVGEDRDHVEEDDHHHADEREPVLAEAPPGQLQLRGLGVTRLGRGGLGVQRGGADHGAVGCGAHLSVPPAGCADRSTSAACPRSACR